MENQIDVEKNKQEFIDIVNKYVKRKGIDKLMGWLENSDFFIAPASTRFHLACKGGLCQHSLNVYYRLSNEYLYEYGFDIMQDDDKKAETIAIISLFHDICKVNFYKEDVRNVKDKESGQWIQQPYYTIDEKVPIGHGEKSVIILQQFMKLSMEEIIAINSHMGFSDSRFQGGYYSIVNSWEQYPMALLLHIADLKASKIDEKDM